MTNLLESPTAENIKGFKDVTVNTVDLILSDNNTSIIKRPGIEGKKTFLKR
jgi:hypothetical protein